MGIGSSIFLIALGAILAFAVPGGVVTFIDLHMVGYILMVVGVIGLIVSLLVFGPRRARRVSESRASVDPVTGERIVTRDSRDTGI
ncbi:DUF6458 family protein [Arthrobacter sp. FW306-04-A]|uniref:DUF6458 family protein n=1 Tax=Arthrobacter sp. FW306-04-A TaxID=2879619 RepID=UPI0037C08547|nr:DUF6458 family protein [Arthrobacter sp. FW306-04-A]